MNITPESMALKIEHTILKPDADYASVDRIVDEAIKYKFAAVCVNPCFVSRVATKLRGSSVGITTVVGFPLGATFSSVKAFEAEKAVEVGATEIDMVINTGAVKSHDYDRVIDDIRIVRAAVPGVCLTVILETGLLENDEIIMCCKLAVEAGADFVKASSGFVSTGAKASHIALMRKAVGTKKGVKASGGIRNLKDAIEMLEAGANRLGCSASINIVDELSR
ncbi:deoxyribose-phosphate aldolase [Myxococcota bacterium]|nr:deoxyribose-phosphate aldolase [Myxococcota bacterium]MBU1380075.1 deoxyribose-phosphate aldolase [Myxococcota bacterium]MBU1495533.1 deoxyribose-phosphate aldolase [Myxococcota bacterium]